MLAEFVFILIDRIIGSEVFIISRGGLCYTSLCLTPLKLGDNYVCNIR